MIQTPEEFIEKKIKEFTKDPFHYQKDKEREGSHKFRRISYRIYKEGERKIIVVSKLIREGFEGKIVFKDISKLEMEFIRSEYWIITTRKKSNKEYWAYGQYPANVPIHIYNELMKENLSNKQNK